MNHRITSILLAILPLALAGCEADPVAPAAAPVRAMQPQTALAVAAVNAPLGTVPATVSLPPAARVAVTAPFAGSVQRIHVLEGQDVQAGQLLATVVSRDALSLASSRARADARVSLAQANAARIGQLAAEGVIAGARADEARAALREAQVDRAEAARILARGGASADGIVQLRAPIAGRVSRVSIETGGPLDGMTAPFVIDGHNRYALDLQLPERLAGQVRPGMAVLLPGGARGEILSVAPGLDPATRSVNAIARIGAAPGLLAGGSLSVVVLGDANSSAVAVPAAAVARVDGRDVVFVRGKDGFQPVPIVLGGSANGVATILEGLAVGTTVAVSNLPELKSQAAN